MVSMSVSGLDVLAVTPIVAAFELPIEGIDKIGIVALLILAVVAIWREGLRRQDKLEAIIDRNTKALTEVSDAMLECKRAAR
jgi:hypothetical protein